MTNKATTYTNTEVKEMLMVPIGDIYADNDGELISALESMTIGEIQYDNNFKFIKCVQCKKPDSYLMEIVLDGKTYECYTDDSRYLSQLVNTKTISVLYWALKNFKVTGVDDISQQVRIIDHVCAGF